MLTERRGRLRKKSTRRINPLCSANSYVFYVNDVGRAEQWLNEGRDALKWTRLSCRRFKDNQVRLQLFGLAYNLGNFLRQLTLPREVKHRSLTALRERQI